MAMRGGSIAPWKSLKAMMLTRTGAVRRRASPGVAIAVSASSAVSQILVRIPVLPHLLESARCLARAAGPVIRSGAGSAGSAAAIAAEVAPVGAHRPARAAPTAVPTLPIAPLGIVPADPAAAG